MMRTLALLVRRPDLTRYAFRNHYEDTHVPLAEPLLDEATHYVRNHVQAIVAGAPVDFDVLSEFGYPSAVELGRLTERLASPEGQAIAADERRFMDKPRNRFFQLIGPRGASTGAPPERARTKLALLVRRSTDVDRADLLAALDTVHGRLVADGATVLPFETGPLGQSPPFDAVSFIWPGDRSSGCSRLEVPGGEVTIVRVDERVMRRARAWSEA